MIHCFCVNVLKLEVIIFVYNMDFNLGELGDNNKSPCFPGMQSMAGVHTKAFYCEPRLAGSIISIKQYTSEKTMSICEVAAYTEAKRK